MIGLTFGARRRSTGASPSKVRSWARDLAAAVARVGLPESADGPRRAEGEGELPLTLVEVATFNEFGTRRIPPRPFMKISAASGKPVLAVLAGRLWKKALRGQQDPGQILDILGAKHASQVQETIAEGVPPPNHPRTVFLKGSSRTLIATGQMRQAITWVVDKAGGVSRG